MAHSHRSLQAVRSLGARETACEGRGDLLQGDPSAEGFDRNQRNKRDVECRQHGDEHNDQSTRGDVDQLVNGAERLRESPIGRPADSGYPGPPLIWMVERTFGTG